MIRGTDFILNPDKLEEQFQLVEVSEWIGRPGAGADVHGKQGAVLLGVHGVVAGAARDGGGFRCTAAAQV